MPLYYNDKDVKEKVIYDEKVLDIMKTNDYDKFTNIIGNRNLNDKNYRKLINSMKEQQLIIPILVGSDYSIIDGQHRFCACKALGLDVYYYMVQGYGIEEVKKANQVSCNWTLYDYLNLHKELGKQPYLEFEAIMHKYRLIVSQLLEITAGVEGREYPTVKQEFETGNFEFTNPMAVHKFLDDLGDFVEFKDFHDYYSTRFTKAFLKLYTYEKYEHKLMQKKLQNLGHKLSRRQTYVDYLTLLVNEIYSYGSSTIGFKYDPYSNRFYDLKGN